MDNVIRYARPRRSPGRARFRRPDGWVLRYAGLVLLAICIGGAALVGHWINGRFGSPPSAPALIGVHAVDGDTLRTSAHGKTQRIRLSGIDAPELTQTCRDPQGRSWACGTKARSHLSTLVARGGVTCTRRGEDRYGRMLATCTATGIPDIGEAMVRAGYAVNYSRYTSDYASAEREARAARRGLWQGEFDNPEDWRRHARVQ